CTICWPSDKMEFIAMTGCLSGTNRHFGNFYCDFKGVEGGGKVRTRGGCSYGYGGSSALWWGHCRGAGPPGAKGGIGSHPGRVLLRSGGEFGFIVGAPPDPRTARVRRGWLEFAPGAGAPTAERVLVSAFDQSRSSRVTVMSWRDTSTFQKV